MSFWKFYFIAFIFLNQERRASQNEVERRIFGYLMGAGVGRKCAIVIRRVRKESE